MSIDVATRRPTVLDALQPVLGALNVAGIRATMDIAQLNPPGCLLGAPELDFRFNAGDFTATYSLIVVVGSTDKTRAIGNLSEYLSEVMVALGDRPLTARPVDVTLADASTVLPGYELRWSTRIRHR